MKQKRTHLTREERDQIALLKAQGNGVRDIARALGRSFSTISDELKRNRWGDNYVAIHAQEVAENRRSRAGFHQPLKSPELYAYVLEHLGWGWSPEEIAGRLVRDFPDQPKINLHHETIYRFIYAEENKNLRLWEKLPRKQKRRKKKYGRKSQRLRIPDRVSIHNRPKVVPKRKQFGHWEADSIIGKGHRTALHTTVERKSRYLDARVLSHHDASQTTDAEKDIYGWLPKEARRTVTKDNGLEFAQHKEISDLIRSYFADPYASWQRGTNENTNGLIRRYLPKKTDFSTLTQEELDDIVEEINTRPRKCLQYQTPKEVFLRNLAKCSDST